MDDTRDIPEGYTWQVGSSAFWFSIITDSKTFKRYNDFAEDRGLSVNVCREDEPRTENEFIHVIQKSQTWLRLREESSGTASALGKYIKGPPMYPDERQITAAWQDKIAGAKFYAEHTTRGHMKWGVGYEDPALIHFAVENMVSVSQVGTIRVPLSCFITLARKYGVPVDIDLSADPDFNLLISPDGIVSRCPPEERGTRKFTADGIPVGLIGMLEIKCISPFHHVENDDGTLSWVDDMEKRQWYSPRQIPWGYVVQICVQAISGLHRLDMKDTDTMWFIRWSPRGFSEFNVQFKHLIPLGILSTFLYYTVKQRIKSQDDLPFGYVTELEKRLYRQMTVEYDKLMGLMKHRYVNHEGLYPEFTVYRKCTERFRFNVPA
jgi:hypothetical protein